jgi:hypothetical protein
MEKINYEWDINKIYLNKKELSAIAGLTSTKLNNVINFFKIKKVGTKYPVEEGEKVKLITTLLDEGMTYKGVKRYLAGESKLVLI